MNPSQLSSLWGMMIQQVNRRINCFASPHQKISATFRFVGCSGLQNLYIHCKYELNKGMTNLFLIKQKYKAGPINLIIHVKQTHIYNWSTTLNFLKISIDQLCVLIAVSLKNSRPGTLLLTFAVVLLININKVLFNIFIFDLCSMQWSKLLNSKNGMQTLIQSKENVFWN